MKFQEICPNNEKCITFLTSLTQNIFVKYYLANLAYILNVVVILLKRVHCWDMARELIEIMPLGINIFIDSFTLVSSKFNILLILLPSGKSGQKYI